MASAKDMIVFAKCGLVTYYLPEDEEEDAIASRLVKAELVVRRTDEGHCLRDSRRMVDSVKLTPKGSIFMDGILAILG
ncbi:MAG: hypothetical protein UY48_C0006G0010 [Candidatus Gottesmanbacteria bacterium GW2011_GWB1_49_7]|uniref:Uncharacterized protein n=1 Tax=Candidatus Gottesmanbacteria bacterium GW2011_GWB1_49_7 TaxID=1618448 RepID=A0A0G1YD99_9BACT|nr:MAG: hypothetical protein UY48_C0006G0010 [Candidatus Gottesmanbacteria bacterium GW2011_GWB1_49_7]